MKINVLQSPTTAIFRRYQPNIQTKNYIKPALIKDTVSFKGTAAVISDTEDIFPAYQADRAEISDVMQSDEVKNILDTFKSRLHFAYDRAEEKRLTSIDIKDRAEEAQREVTELFKNGENDSVKINSMPDGSIEMTEFSDDNSIRRTSKFRNNSALESISAEHEKYTENYSFNRGGALCKFEKTYVQKPNEQWQRAEEYTFNNWEKISSYTDGFKTPKFNGILYRSEEITYNDCELLTYKRNKTPKTGEYIVVDVENKMTEYRGITEANTKNGTLNKKIIIVSDDKNQGDFYYFEEPKFMHSSNFKGADRFAQIKDGELQSYCEELQLSKYGSSKAKKYFHRNNEGELEELTHLTIPPFVWKYFAR